MRGVSYVSTDLLPTCLYRFFTASGLLVYIGIAGDPDVRERSHARHALWYVTVAYRTEEWFATREAAARAESSAIVREDPPFNRALSRLSMHERLRLIRKLIEDSPKLSPNSLLNDVLSIWIEGCKGIHAKVLIERLREINLEYVECTPHELTSRLKPLGVPSVQIWFRGKNAQGYRLRDIERACGKC